MSFRFQADANLNADILTGVIRHPPQVNFQSAEVAGLRRLPDPKVLALAAEEQRILVTHDLRTMPRHFSHAILATPRRRTIPATRPSASFGASAGTDLMQAA